MVVPSRNSAPLRCLIIVGGVLGFAEPSSAGLLDSLRAIDINDYAVGMGVSTTENIYVGGADSQTIYPFLTKLVPSALDDGVIFGRDGAYGVRWLPENGLEIGALAKLQTLGFEEGDSELLEGLPDRAWTVEAGPTLGWRGPVHVDWTSFLDVLRNHRGSNHLLRLSVPRAFPRGYVIPEVGYHRYTDQFVDYYYGVPAEAATPERPAYVGEAANGLSLGVAWGVRVTPHWIFTGALDIERFGSQISRSPIVDDDDQTRLTLQVTYDGAPFFAPDAPVSFPVNLDFALAQIKGDSPDSAGDLLRYFEAAVRFARRHRAVIGGFDATYSHAPALGMAEEIRIRNLELLYGYDVLDDRQKTVTIEAGLHIDEISSNNGALQLGRSTKPLPMLAVDAAAHFESRFSLRAKLHLLLLDGEYYSGRQLFASFGVFHRTFDNVRLGVGYVFNRVALSTGSLELATRLEPLHQGPSLLVSASF
jgi:outer membrane scaffolding protein for murein synthesis (MipA/OmpV family)